ncbi:MAG: hypothetical protein ABI185_08085 [Ginsengibacter sp.]
MKKLVSLFFIFLSFHASGQPFANFHDTFYKKNSGYIELNSGEKINGDFEYAFWEFPTYNLKLLSSSEKVMKRYYIPNIKKVVLTGSDHWLTNRDSTYFIVHDKSRHFYRQLTFGKDFQLYDGFFNTDGYVGLVTNYFLAKTKKRFIEFKNSDRLKKWLKENYPDEIKWNDNITIQDIIRQLNGKI